MTDIHTEEKLLEALRESTKESLTSDERDRQRLSFVAGLVGDGSDVTRDKIREVLEKH